MRFAIVGLGGATSMFHVPALRRIAGADLVGGVDLSAERRERWKRDTGSPVYGSLDELVEQVRPDVVVVATPPNAHVELCLRALDAGCHVFCEKPLAESAADADRVVEAARAAKRLVAVNLEFREHPIFRAIRDGVASARYGRLAFCQVWQLLDLAPWDEPVSWRAGMADRALLEGGVHLVDLMLAIFGEAPVAVSAQHSAGLHEQREADAVQLVAIEFSGGRLGQITINRLTQAGTRFLEVRADCERASLRGSFGGRANVRVGLERSEQVSTRLELGLGGLAWAEHGLARTTLARNPRDGGVVGSRRLLEDLIRSIEEGGEPSSSAREARDVLTVIEAAYDSARLGARIKLRPAST